MKKVLAVVAIVLAAIIVFFVAKPSGSNDPDGLDGEAWTLVGIEAQGKKIPAGKDRMRIQFTRDKVVWSIGDRGFQGPYRNDSSKKPKEIDLAVPPEEDEPDDGQMAQAIYEIKDNTLFICIGPQRPTEFSAPPRSRRVVWVFRR